MSHPKKLARSNTKSHSIKLPVSSQELNELLNRASSSLIRLCRLSANTRKRYDRVLFLSSIFNLTLLASLVYLYGV